MRHRFRINSWVEIKAYHCVGDFGGQPLHCHEEVEFLAVYRGQGQFQAGCSRHATGPGIFSVVCPQEPHGGTPASPEFAVKVLNVSADWFDAMELDWRFLWRRQALRESPPALATFLQAYEIVQQNQSRLMQDDALRTLHALLRGNAPAPRVSERRRIDQAVEALRERFTEDISLSELATEVGLTPAYLCRSFTKTLGLPPHAYQISLRVARAKTLLEKGTPPATVAQEVGFYDQSHLNLHFKRLLGVTPSQIVKKSNSSYTSSASDE